LLNNLFHFSANTCGHIQCFDALLYLQMNERKPTWICPVCDMPASYDNLVIDGYFLNIINSPKIGFDDNEIQLYANGSWSKLMEKVEIKNEKCMKLYELSSDEEGELNN
jgi:MIZ/SP-RING zinc finger